MKPNIGLDEQSQKGIAELLNIILADEYVLYTKTYNYHWNLTGAMFNDLHAMFQEQFEMLIVFVDDVAERVRAVGGVALGTLVEFLEHTRLEEQPGDVPSELEMVENLLHDHETIIRHLRNDLNTAKHDFGDTGSAHLLIELLLKHEKTAWLLRSLLAK